MSKRKSNKVATAMTADKVAQVQGLRRSGASGGHDSRPSRQRTRATARRAALREWA